MQHLLNIVLWIYPPNFKSSLFENEKINISDGYIEPPDTYGLGIKFDENCNL